MTTRFLLKDVYEAGTAGEKLNRFALGSPQRPPLASDAWTTTLFWRSLQLSFFFFFFLLSVPLSFLDVRPDGYVANFRLNASGTALGIKLRQGSTSETFSGAGAHIERGGLSASEKKKNVCPNRRTGRGKAMFISNTLLLMGSRLVRTYGAGQAQECQEVSRRDGEDGDESHRVPTTTGLKGGTVQGV